MRPRCKIHCFIIRLHPLRDGHWKQWRIGVSRSAGILRAFGDILTTFLFFRQDAESSTLEACAPQEIVVQCFFYFPHGGTPMFREAVKGAELSQVPQFLLPERNAPFEIFDRTKSSLFPLAY